MFGMDQYPNRDDRLRAVVSMMREVSLQTDPHALVGVYGRRMGEFLKSNGFVSLSRRGHEFPDVRVTRFSGWLTQPDPWLERASLPMISKGLASELLYGNEPRIIEPLELAADDPLREYARDAKCLVFIPHYDTGEAINAVLHFYDQEGAFDQDSMPELVWMSNLFGRAVNNLALTREVTKAYDELDRELKVVEALQLSLLPQEVPAIETLKLAAHYQTSRRAGGDYYDFFQLGDGLWGIFVADVSGHGTPAAVVMAVTHALAHNYPGQPNPPSLMMHYLNQKLCNSPTSNSGNFVTAFYGIYNAKARTLTFCSAGHPEVRLIRGSQKGALGGGRALPLGISDEELFSQSVAQLQPGDRIAIYTDGITESFGPGGEMFATARLDDALAGSEADPQAMINAVLESLGAFTGQARGDDDRTIITGVLS